MSLPELYERHSQLPCVRNQPFANFQEADKTRYFWITQAFESTSGSISNLVNGINEVKSDCADSTLLGSFMENHDNPRFPSYNSDISLAKNAIAFTILADGIPISEFFDDERCISRLIFPSLLWPRTTLFWRSYTP